MIRKQIPFMQGKIRCKDKKILKGYEAARRKKFNGTIEVLRLELELDQCSKVKIVESAIEYIKHAKSLQGCILQENNDETENPQQTSKELNLELKRKISFYKHLLKEANIIIDFMEESNHICATFPVLQMATDNVVLKKKKKVYDLFYNTIDYNSSEDVVSKNMGSQCEKRYFDSLNAINDISQITDPKFPATVNLCKSTVSDIEDFTESCMSNGQIVVGEVKNGLVTVLLPPDESITDKSIIACSVSNDIQKQTLSTLVSPPCNFIKPTHKISTEFQELLVPSKACIDETLGVVCSSRVLLLPMQKSLSPPHITLVTQSPSQGPIMSTGKNHTLLKSNYNSLIFPSVLQPCKKLKKIAPKPLQHHKKKSEIDDSSEKGLAESPIMEIDVKRKSLWKAKRQSKMAKLSNGDKLQNCDIDKPNFDDDNNLTEIATSTLNSLVRNAVMMAVDGEEQPLENLIDFSCMTTADDNSDSDNTLDEEENIVEMLCSIADSKSITSEPMSTISKTYNNSQVSTDNHISIDNVNKKKAEDMSIPSDTNDKIREVNQDFCEATALEPSIAKSNYSVMSLCMPSKTGKVNSPKTQQTETCVEISSLETFKSISNDVNEITPKDTPTSKGTELQKSFASTLDMFSKGSSDEANTNSSLGPLSHTYRHPFPSISIPPIGLPVLSTNPFISGTVSHSISRISCSTTDTVSNVSETNKKVKVAATYFEEKSNDSKIYNNDASSIPTSLTKTQNSVSLSTTTTNISSNPTTTISSSLFSLSTISSYSRPFGFCPLSITEAPTTFSFTLTTQSSSSVPKTSINISAPYSSHDIVINCAKRTTSNKPETTNTTSNSTAISQLLSLKGKETEDNSTVSKQTNLQLHSTHRENSSVNEVGFTSLNPVNCCRSIGSVANSGDTSIYSPIFHTPLKSDVISSTSQTLPSTLSSCGTECVIASCSSQISDSITYSSCSLSSVSSVFSSILSSASVPLNSEKSKIDTNILNKTEKNLCSKKKVDLSIDKQNDNTNRSLAENDTISNRLAGKQADILSEFRMPLLPLSSYANSKSNRDLVEDVFPISFDEQDEIDKNLSRDTPKKSSFDDSNSSTVTKSTPAEIVSQEANVSQSRGSLYKDSFVEHDTSFAAKDKQCELLQLRSNEDECSGRPHLEQINRIEQSSLDKNSQGYFPSEDINRKLDKNEPTDSSKLILSSNIVNTDLKKNSQSLNETHESMNKSFHSDEIQQPLDQNCKTVHPSKVMGSIPTTDESNKYTQEPSNIEKDTIDNNLLHSNVYRKNVTFPNKDISLSSSKNGFGSDIVFLADPLITAKDNKDSTLQEKVKITDKNEVSLTKNCGVEPMVCEKISEHFVVSEDTNRSNVQLKMCDREVYSEMKQISAPEQNITVLKNRNSEMITSGQKLITKLQSGIHLPPFSNVCLSQPVSIHTTHLSGITANKNVQSSDQLIMCGSDDALKSISHSSPNNTANQFDQHSLNHHSLSQHQIQQNVPLLSQQQSAILQNNQATDILPFYTGTDRETTKSSSGPNSIPTMMPGCSYVQTFDYNSYRKPGRFDSRYNCPGYKQFPQNNTDFLSDAVILPNQPPAFAEGHDELSLRGVEISPSDHVRGFSVSHLVSHSSDSRKLTQKDSCVDDKSKDVPKGKSTSKKSEGKGRLSTASKNTSLANETRQRGQTRNTGNFAQCFNNKTQTKNIPNYSTEAILSSQNYIRQNHRQPINQNYHFMPHNQMYQPSYSSQQVKNLSQNVPFSYSNHDRSGPSMHCNTDYNFQLHTQASSTLTPYGSNMPYMTPSYPYQNIPPSSSSMISGDIMAPHAGPYRLPDISDQTNFHSNATFSLPIESQEVCTGNVIGSVQSAMPARMPVSEQAFGISAAQSMHYRNSATKNASIQHQSSASSAKRPKYFDTGMISSGVSTPTNFLDGGSLTHIPIHSFTPPCEDPSSLVHSNLLTSASRHQNNFIIGHESVMPLNGGQYQDPNVNAIGSNLTNQHLQMPSVSKGVASVPQIFSSHTTLRPDRQLNTSASHLSSSLSNFNLTSIIPEIDGKHDDSSTMSSSSSRQLSAMGTDSISMTGYNRLPNMGTTYVPTGNNIKDGGSHIDPSHRFVPMNSMNNIFGHPHQVGLNLNSGLPIPTSTFSGMSFQPSEH